MSRKNISALSLAIAVVAPFGLDVALVSVAKAQAAAQAAVTDPIYEYRLGSGDKVRIGVFGEPDLTGEFVVSGDGKVSFPLIGEVDALGVTASQLQGKIADKLKGGYLNDPKVTVEVLNFRPFFILGEVNKPGQYDFANGMTVERAVATASGYTYRADKKKVYIKHATDGREVEVPLSSQVMIQPGDTIRIGERYF